MPPEPNTAVSAPYTVAEGVVEAVARAIDPQAFRTAAEWLAANPPHTPEQMRLFPGDTMEARTLRFHDLADRLYAEAEPSRTAARQTAAIAIAASALADLVAALEWFTAHQSSIAADLSSAHRVRGDAASQWMREEDAELRRYFRGACDAARAALAKAKGETL